MTLLVSHQAVAPTFYNKIASMELMLSNLLNGNVPQSQL